MKFSAWRGVLAVGCVLLLAACESRTFGPPERVGPPLLVMQGDEPRLWLLVKIEESRQRYLRSGSRMLGNWVTERHYHFDLHTHDGRTAQRLATKRLASVPDKDGGYNARGRMLGPDGEAVWLFLHDEPLALAMRDGSVLIDGAGLAERNPSLKDVLPKELDFYVFDDGLVVTTADGRRVRVRASAMNAEPYQPASEDHFRQAQFMATQWNGGYQAKDFMTRQITLGGRWLGLLSEREAQDAGDDGFGDHFKDSSQIFHEGARARRTFWTARIGKTKEFSEGAHDRLFDVTKVPNAPEFLEAGLLIKQGTRAPLILSDPTGMLVLHRTRLDDEGRLALTCLDEGLREQWKATLPMTELRNRFELSGRLLFYGAAQVERKGARNWQELIVALDLRDGKMQAWNVTLEKKEP